MSDPTLLIGVPSLLYLAICILNLFGLAPSRSMPRKYYIYNPARPLSWAEEEVRARGYPYVSTTHLAPGESGYVYNVDRCMLPRDADLLLVTITTRRSSGASISTATQAATPTSSPEARSRSPKRRTTSSGCAHQYTEWASGQICHAEHSIEVKLDQMAVTSLKDTNCSARQRPIDSSRGRRLLR